MKHLERHGTHAGDASQLRASDTGHTPLPDSGGAPLPHHYLSAALPAYAAEPLVRVCVSISAKNRASRAERRSLPAVRLRSVGSPEFDQSISVVWYIWRLGPAAPNVGGLTFWYQKRSSVSW